MSKSLGNVIDSSLVLDTLGADALRWYMLTGGNPWANRRLSVEIIQESLRKFLLTLWNTYSFWVTYAAIENFDPRSHDMPVADRPEMDRWILAELDDTVRAVTAGLDDFDTASGGRRLDRFVDDLSNWYVRRNRRRFWRSGTDADTTAAFLTLWECLVTVAQLTAPFTPFVADAIYTNLTAPDDSAADSVHLARWPAPNDARVDDALRTKMQLARRLVSLGREVRTSAKVRTRQPLRNALVAAPAEELGLIADVAETIADELNVKNIEVVSDLGEYVTYSVKPNFKLLGPRFGARVTEIAAALGKQDQRQVAEAAQSRGRYDLALGDENITLELAELDIRQQPQPGFTAASQGRYGIALDLTIDDELRAEGIAREVIRGIQDLRKKAGLAVEDRIVLSLETDDRPARDALDTHRDYIANEVLATELGASGSDDPAATDELTVDDVTVRVALRRA